MATAKDYSEAVSMISRPEAFGLPAGTYYMGALVGRHTMLGHNLPWILRFILAIGLGCILYYIGLIFTLQFISVGIISLTDTIMKGASMVSDKAIDKARGLAYSAGIILQGYTYLVNPDRKAAYVAEARAKLKAALEFLK